VAESEPTGRCRQNSSLILDDGTVLLRESWRTGVGKFVAVGSVCAYPKYTPVPFREEELWHGYPEETNARTGWPRRCCWSRARPTAAVWIQLHLSVAGESVRAGRQYGSRAFARDPALIRKCFEAGRLKRTDRSLGHWLGNPRVSVRRMRRRGFCWLRNGMMAPSRSIWAVGWRSASGI